MKVEKSLLREEMLWPANHQDGIASAARSTGFAARVMSYLKNIPNRVLLSFKGAEAKASSAPDPAIAIIMQIDDLQMRTMIKELHYLTPTSLKTMRGICQECFFLPEDCAYIDYSIPDVNKAIKRIKSHAVLSSSPEKIINELAKVNGELTRHLQDYFEPDHR